MRDSSIIHAQQQAARRDALLFQQIEFLQTRIDALEGTFLASSPENRAEWMETPQKFRDVVDAVHADILSARHRAAAEEAVKTKIQVVPAGAI
jgi:hypothetical protein